MARELIRLEGVHRSFGPTTVLEGVNVRIEEGDRIGIVGHNGAGKTTLLRTISEQDQDLGEISFAPGLRIAFLTQVRDIDEGATLEEELERKGRQFEEIDAELADIEGRMADPSFYDGDWQADIDRYQELQSMNAKSGGSNVASRAQEILRALDLSQHPMDTQLELLSGGERAKVALARQLVGLSEIEVFFLDEPTNHLDLETLDWLEQFLLEFEGAIVVVSHDRYFLDRICNAILEVQDAHVKGYIGDYSSFLKQKALFLQTLDDRIQKTQKELRRLKGAVQSMKSANKYDKSISQKHVMINRAQRELKWLRSLKPKSRRGLKFSLESSEKSSLEVLDIKRGKLTFSELDRPIFDSVDIGVRRGQKIGVVGGNGAGKTTLLRTIMGELKLDEGEIDVRPGVKIGYFHQDHRSLNFDLTPIEQIRFLKPRMDYGDIRALLGQFQFTKDMVGTKLSSLSGGERARIALLKLLLEENNLLLLDEPTNHLDTDAKEALEEALIRYDGSIITVSHDRWFLDKICDTIWEVPGNGSVVVWPGNYSRYMERVRKRKNV